MKKIDKHLNTAVNEKQEVIKKILKSRKDNKNLRMAMKGYCNRLVQSYSWTAQKKDKEFVFLQK